MRTTELMGTQRSGFFFSCKKSGEFVCVDNEFGALSGCLHRFHLLRCPPPKVQQSPMALKKKGEAHYSERQVVGIGGHGGSA